jgi:preprotein translocase subunit SecA
MITIATNLAGRGTNPKLHPDSMQAGGLGMRFTFYPHNTRVKTQGFGRAGRQGQPGCAGMILGIDDPYFKENEHNN